VVSQCVKMALSIYLVLFSSHATPTMLDTQK
jgi:hypothetical protein